MSTYSNNSGLNTGFVADGSTESSKSGVSWSSILVGAFAATAVTLILMALGSGLGFSMAPDANDYGASNMGDYPAAKFGLMAAIWLLVVQWLSSALGGYITGRLRTKWVGLHTDEVFFRDTAHGFASWAVASVVVAAFAICTASTALKAGADIAAKSDMAMANPMDYQVDRLFRTGEAAPASLSDMNLRAEAKRIFVSSVGHDMADTDRAYLSRLVSSRTSLSPADARTRVDSVVADQQAAEAKARQAAEDARRAAARFSLFTFVAMLVGALIASAAAALGGIHRDDTDVVMTNTI